MSVCPECPVPVCLCAACLTICLSVFLSVCLSVFLSVCPSVLKSFVHFKATACALVHAVMKVKWKYHVTVGNVILVLCDSVVKVKWSNHMTVPDAEVERAVPGCQPPTCVSIERTQEHRCNLCLCRPVSQCNRIRSKFSPISERNLTKPISPLIIFHSSRLGKSESFVMNQQFLQLENSENTLHSSLLTFSKQWDLFSSDNPYDQETAKTHLLVRPSQSSKSENSCDEILFTITKHFKKSSISFRIRKQGKMLWLNVVYDHQTHWFVFIWYFHNQKTDFFQYRKYFS